MRDCYALQEQIQSTMSILCRGESKSYFEVVIYDCFIFFRSDIEVKAILPQLPHGPKFSGGGFNMSSGTKSRTSAHHPREVSPSDAQSVTGVSVVQQLHDEDPEVQSQGQGRASSAPLVQVPSAVEESGSVVT